MANRKRSKSLLMRAYDLKAGDEAQSLYRDWATSYGTDLVDPLATSVGQTISKITNRFS